VIHVFRFASAVDIEHFLAIYADRLRLLRGNCGLKKSRNDRRQTTTHQFNHCGQLVMNDAKIEAEVEPKSGRRPRAKVAKTAKGGTYGKGRNHRVGDPFNVSPTS